MTKTSSNFFAQWPDRLVAIICSGAPNIIDLGLVTPNSSQQLERMGVMLFKRGLQPSVTMQVKAYRSSVLIGSSDIYLGSDLESAYAGNNFLGFVRFTFEPRLNLSSGTGTRFQLELGSEYAYDEDSSWIGAVLDWPVTMGYNSNPGNITAAPIAMELYAQGAIR